MTAALSTRVSDRWRKSENAYVCVAFKEVRGLLETPRDCGLLRGSVGHVLACVQKSAELHVVGVRRRGRLVSCFALKNAALLIFFVSFLSRKSVSTTCGMSG